MLAISHPKVPCGVTGVSPQDRATTLFYTFHETVKKLSCLSGKEVYVLNTSKIWDLIGKELSPPFEFYNFNPESEMVIKELFMVTYNYVESLQDAEGSDFIYLFYGYGGKHDEIVQMITENLPPVVIPRSAM